MEGVESVTSITNIINIKSDSLGMEVGQLVDEYNLPKSASELKALKEEIDQNEMYKGDIVSTDGKSTIIMFSARSLELFCSVSRNLLSSTASGDRRALPFMGCEITLFPFFCK